MSVIFAVNLAAQNKCTVSGYIRDAATGETLIGAGVMVMVTDAASGGGRPQEYRRGRKPQRRHARQMLPLRVLQVQSLRKKP